MNREKIEASGLREHSCGPECSPQCAALVGPRFTGQCCSLAVSGCSHGRLLSFLARRHRFAIVLNSREALPAVAVPARSMAPTGELGTGSVFTGGVDQRRPIRFQRIEHRREVNRCQEAAGPLS